MRVHDGTRHRSESISTARLAARNGAVSTVNETPVGTVAVVGGGDAGLITALTLERLAPELDVTVVDDFDEEPPEVGKSTISYILNTFHNVLEIDRKRFVTTAKPVWKASVYFRDWCGRAFHVPFDDFTLQPEEPGSRRFETLYHRHDAGDFRTLGVELAERRKSPFVEDPNGNLKAYPNVAYHLSVDRLNGLLWELCEERGVELVDDRITGVATGSAGIERVHGAGGEYEADLYVDATGFGRALMGELDNEFREFDFPLDSAVFAKAELSRAEVVPATVIESGEYGWFWQIDTVDWRDVGYVYASAYTSDEEALEEFVAGHDVEREAVRQYRFESGVHDRAWVKNCVAVGNALGFVEPLQSTALTTNAILTEQLAELLSDHRRLNHPGVRDIYNTFARTLWENIHEFISLHYRYAPETSEFWDAMRTVGGDRVDTYIANYHDNGFTSHHHFGGHDGPTRRIFNQWQFYRVLRGLGVRSSFYESVDVDVRTEVKREVAGKRERLSARGDDHLAYDELERTGVY